MAESVVASLSTKIDGLSARPCGASTLGWRVPAGAHEGEAEDCEAAWFPAGGCVLLAAALLPNRALRSILEVKSCSLFLACLLYLSHPLIHLEGDRRISPVQADDSAHVSLDVYLLWMETEGSVPSRPKTQPVSLSVDVFQTEGSVHFPQTDDSVRCLSICTDR